jgi:hypothetical protein
MRLPGFCAETSAGNGHQLYRKSGARTAQPETGVVFAGSDICNCNCGGASGTSPGSTTTAGPPGICSCSSVLGIGCSTSSNSCNPGFVPQCNCGVFGNSCQCVPGGS